MRLVVACLTVAAIAVAAESLVSLADLSGSAVWAVYIGAMVTAGVVGMIIAPPSKEPLGRRNRGQRQPRDT